MSNYNDEKCDYQKLCLEQNTILRKIKTMQNNIDLLQSGYGRSPNSKNCYCPTGSTCPTGATGPTGATIYAQTLKTL